MVEGRTRLGEVVETCTTEFTVHCYRLYQAPPLGALVKAGTDPEVVAVTFWVSTRGLDPGRRPIPRGEEAETEEEVYQDHPQLSRLLCTEFRALILGYQPGDGPPCYSLPPYPPRIHAFVHLCSPQEVRAFTASLDFLPLLLRASLPSGDEVLAACLRGASGAHEDPQAFLLHAARELAILLGGEVQRLNAILKGLAQ